MPDAALERFVAEAKERSQTLEHVPERDREHVHARVVATEPALRALREAAVILTERDAAFTARSLEQRARQMSLGTAWAEQIEQAVAQLQSRGELVERLFVSFWTAAAVHDPRSDAGGRTAADHGGRGGPGRRHQSLVVE